MSGPPGDHTVRSLAEILREHGLESEFGTRPGRRRREGEPKADWPARPAPEDQPPSKLRPGPDGGPGTGSRGRQTPAQSRDAAPRKAPAPPRGASAAPPRPEARTQAEVAEILRQHGLESEFGTRPKRSDEAARADWPARPAPADQPHSRLRPPADPGPPAQVARPREAPREEARTGRNVSAAPAAPAPASPAPAAARAGAAAPAATPPAAPAPRSSHRAAATAGPTTSGIRGLRPSRKPGVPSTDDPVATGSFAAVAAGALAAETADPDAPPPTAVQSALAWLRFALELLLAVGIGVGTYFAFTVLWELMPYVALIAAPLVLTALVAGVAAWRHRHEQAQLGVPLLAVLVFAGALLVIAPAAGLLAG
ncbi:hypothetical protein [Modestobacter sp. URMC 112]